MTSAAALAVGAANAAGTEVRDAATRVTADAMMERAAAERAAVWSFFIDFCLCLRGGCVDAALCGGFWHE